MSLTDTTIKTELLSDKSRDAIKDRARQYLTDHRTFGADAVILMLYELEELEKRLGDCMNTAMRSALYRRINAAAITLETIIKTYEAV